MTDTPRLLHRRSEHAYTSDPTRALTDAGEAVPEDAQLAITARSHRSARQTQLTEWADSKTALERQVNWLEAQRFHRDIRSEVRALQRQIDRLDQRLRSTP